MAFEWLSHEIAFRGLHNYLVKHSYANAVTTQLWEALEATSGEPVLAVMKNWTLKPGYPYVSIESSDRSGGALHAHAITLRSKRFISAWAANPTAWPTASDFVGGPSPAAAEAAAEAWRLPTAEKANGAASDPAAPTDDW